MGRANARLGYWFTVLDGATSTGPGGDFTLETPVSELAMECITGSSDAVVFLQGTLQKTTDATWTTLGEWASSDVTTGSIIAADSSWLNVPIPRIRAVLNAGASSDGVSAWVVGR